MLLDLGAIWSRRRSLLRRDGAESRSKGYPLATGERLTPRRPFATTVSSTRQPVRGVGSTARPTRGLGRGAITSRSRPPTVTPIASGLRISFTSLGVHTTACREEWPPYRDLTSAPWPVFGRVVCPSWNQPAAPAPVPLSEPAPKAHAGTWPRPPAPTGTGAWPGSSWSRNQQDA